MSPGWPPGPTLGLLGVALIWGASFVIVKEALDDASPILFLALRFTVATAALFLLFRARGRVRLEKQAARDGVLAGVLLFGAYAFQTAGLRFTTPSKSAFLTGTCVILVPFLAAAVSQTWPLAREVLGAVLALTGLGLLTVESQRPGIGLGDGLTLAGAAGYAGHIVAVGYFAARAHIAPLALAQLATVAVCSWATCWWIETPIAAGTANLAAAIVVTGVLATALAFSVQVWAQKQLSPGRTALLMATEPVFAAATAFGFYGERFTPAKLAGAGLILAGILVVELKHSGFARHR